MFEFDKYRGPRHSITRPEEAYTPFPAAPERAMLLWGEHCVECAAPDCFNTCDLYAARPDRRCRRFVHGIYRTTSFPSAQGYGAEVIFKKWARLEARGNATLFRQNHVRWMEKLADSLSRFLNPLGRMLDYLLKDIRWSYMSFALSERMNDWLRRRRDPARLPDSFVVELYNPTLAPTTLTLSMSIHRNKLKRGIASDQLPPPMLRKLTIQPGYFLNVVPLDEFRAIVESDLPFGIALTPQDDTGAHLVFLTLDFVRRQKDAVQEFAPPPVSQIESKPAKCVVFDLDNTLWDGVLVEGAVRLRAGVLELFRELDERGILISVASKNAYDEAIQKLVEFGLEEYVLFPHINWGSKSESLKRISADIDIGLDTIIFIDDSPFEREEVQRMLPMVECLVDTAMVALITHPRLRGSKTSEAASRRVMYRQSMRRQSEAVAFGDDYLAFLRTCNIEAHIRPQRPEDFERIAELVQRTNQLNFSGRNYGRNEISRIIADDNVEKYVVTCADKFGSYGMIGFCLAVYCGRNVRVLDLMLSCRVQGKFIEQALFRHLTHRPEWTANAISVDFNRTARNRLAEAILDKLGFHLEEDGNRCRSVVCGDFAVDFISVKGAWPTERKSTSLPETKPNKSNSPPGRSCVQAGG